MRFLKMGSMAAAAVGIAAIAACGSTVATQAAKTAPGATVTQRMTTTQTPAPAKTRPAPEVTITVRPAPAPAPAPAQITDPWTVVSAYYSEIDSQNYSEVWNLLGPALQARNLARSGSLPSVARPCGPDPVPPPASLCRAVAGGPR
jgi:hypothetical protein